MIEGLQVVENLALFSAKIPGNTSSLLDSLSDLASLKLIDFDTAIEDSMYLPERNSHSSNLETAGNESIYMVTLLGTQYLYTVLIGIIWFLNTLLLLLADRFPWI